MILKLQFPSCSKGPSGTGTGWALLIVMRKKENNLNTWENKIMWSVMFLVLIRQKRKISQLLFLYDLLNKNYFQAETKKYITSGCHLCASHWSTESTYINHGTGRRMKLLPSWLSLPPPTPCHPFTLVPYDCFSGPGILLQMSHPLQSVLLLERAKDDNLILRP